jgi:hypothetical protein
VEVDGFSELHAPLREETNTACWGSTGYPRDQQQVPPLRYAPVGMTNLLLGQSYPGELSPSK